MTTYPKEIKDTYAAGQAWLRKQLEKDDLSLPDYPRPLWKQKRAWKWPSVIKFLRQFLP